MLKLVMPCSDVGNPRLGKSGANRQLIKQAVNTLDLKTQYLALASEKGHRDFRRLFIYLFIRIHLLFCVHFDLLEHVFETT
jgi:hypothetical protein